LCGGIGVDRASTDPKKKGVCPEFWTPKRGQTYIHLPPSAEQKYPGISAEMQCKKAKLEWFKNSTAWSTNAIYKAGTRELNFPQSITLKNCVPECHYLWHAQYECVDPPMDQIGATTPTTPTTAPTTTTNKVQSAIAKAKEDAAAAILKAKKAAKKTCKKSSKASQAGSQESGRDASRKKGVCNALVSPRHVCA